MACVGLGEQDGECPTPTGTGQSYFKCRSGEPRCIDGAGVCDGLEECSDGSDEAPAICQRQHNSLLNAPDSEPGTGLLFTLGL